MPLIYAKNKKKCIPIDLNYCAYFLTLSYAIFLNYDANTFLQAIIYVLQFDRALLLTASVQNTLHVCSTFQ